MKEYHKIITVYKRDPETKCKFLLEGEFATPELAYLAENRWTFTEKVNGTNIRVMFDGGNLTFGGKTDKAQIPALLVNAFNTSFLPKKAIFEGKFKKGCCLYGEGYGAKIRKGGGNYRPDQGFVLFDVKVGDWWLLREDVEDVARTLGLDVVPIIGHGTLQDAVRLAREGFISQWGDFPAEGIVMRPWVELKTRRGDRLITKVKTKDFRKEN